MFEPDSSKNQKEDDTEDCGLDRNLSEKEKKVLIDLIKNDRKMNSTEYHQFKEGENLPPRMKAKERQKKKYDNQT